ncbi:MAG: DMT family transporter, partial [Synechococcaceae cyanobacterium]|nr:DMT family transporter [Synechococcaceae cyanobacterium]
MAPENQAPPDPPPRHAVAALLGGALAFSLMGVGVKALGSRLPVAEVVLARTLVSLTLTGWLVRRSGVDPRGRRRGLLLVRGLLGTAGLFCVFAALTRLPLAVATVIQYLNPLFTALLAWPLLGERCGRRLVPALGLGWLGVVLLARPGQGSPAGVGDGLLGGVAIALAGALLSALAYVSVRALGRSEHPLVIVLWFPLMAVPLS